jgi:hypothetical protein
MSDLIGVGQRTILLQLAAMKFHDRREEVKTHRIGKTKAKDEVRAPLDAVVLHSLSFDRGSSITRYDGVDAHFVVLRSGDILYLHDVSEYLNASHDFNDRGIAIEFAGNPPSETGKAYKAWKFGTHIPTLAQLDAGRKLVTVLARCFSLRYIYGHKQSCNKICPGPHVWYNVGRWAVQTLGLSDGGTGFSTSNKYCTGVAFPASWSDPKYDLYAGIMDYVYATVDSRFPIP